MREINKKCLYQIGQKHSAFGIGIFFSKNPIFAEFVNYIGITFSVFMKYKGKIFIGFVGKCHIRFLPLFENDLNKIVDYITFGLKNSEAASRLVDDVEAAMEVRRIFYKKRDIDNII